MSNMQLLLLFASISVVVVVRRRRGLVVWRQKVVGVAAGLLARARARARAAGWRLIKVRKFLLVAHVAGIGWLDKRLID